MQTGIPAQDDCSTYHNSSAFLGFVSETAFLMSPNKYWTKVWRLGWPLHNVNLVGLELTCCSLRGVFEFSAWGSSDKLSAAPRSKKNNLASSVHKILHHFSSGQSMCCLENGNLFIFSTMGLCGGFLLIAWLH